MKRSWIGVTKSSGFIGILLLAGLVLFQGQTFYGKRQTGFYKTKEDGAAFGYFIPQKFDQKKAYPLVVVFGRKATDVMTWKDLANKEGLIVLAIQPKYGGVWNWNWDMDRALKKIEEVKKWYPIDAGKVWATGYEEGGDFALLITINHPEIVSKASVVEAKGATMEIPQGDSGDKADPFNFTDKTELHRPLQLLSFTKSERIAQEDLAKTREVLSKFGYPVAYGTLEGESYSPTAKMSQEMYGWFKS